MPRLRYKIHQDLSKFVLKELQSKLPYVDSSATNVTLTVSADYVEYDIEDKKLMPRISTKIDEMIKKLSEDVFEPEVEIIASNKGLSPYNSNPMPQLEAEGEVFKESEGIYTIGPIGSKIIAWFADEVLRLANERNAKHFRFPSLISSEYLEKVKYFTNFPHSLSFVTHLQEDIEKIQKFSRTAYTEDGEIHVEPDVFHRPKAMLSPTICHHLYCALEDKTVPNEGYVATAEGNCFRFESENMHTLERVWNFTMREIIFVGTEDYVRKAIEDLRTAFADVLTQIGLSFRLETANDPFFIDTFSEQASFQAIFDMKYEYRADVPYRDKDIAIASVNRHGDFFGRTLNIITEGGDFAQTGCFGLGFERIVWAVFCQYGPEPENWPDQLQRIIRN